MRPLIASILAAAALAAVPTISAAKEKPTGEEKLAKLLEGRVAGEPRNCISLTGSNSSQIVDGTAIVYRSGGTLWVNRPRSGADSLRDDDVLVTRTTGSQLCRVDSVQLHDRNGHFWRGFVMLGDFIPYRRAETASVQ